MVGIGVGIGTEFRSGSLAAGSTWSVADASTLWTRSNGNRTVIRSGVSSGSWAMVRGTTGRAAGKWYWELAPLDTVVGNGNFMIGVANGAAAAGSYIGATPSGAGLRSDQSFLSGFSAGTGALMPDQSTAPGDAIGIGLDADLGRVWFAKNNTWIGAGNPAAGTNAAYTYVPGTVGAVFPAVGGTLALIRWTLRSVLAEFAFTPPSGFAPGG